MKKNHSPFITGKIEGLILIWDMTYLWPWQLFTVSASLYKVYTFTSVDAPYAVLELSD